MVKIYAGIGSRATPKDMQQQMMLIGRILSERGWKLRSGHADGADQAFELSTMNREIHLPWKGYNNRHPGSGGFIVPEMTDQVMAMAAKFHPTWWNLSDAVKKLMARNTTIILGQHLLEPADMVICWTKHGLPTGGTGHGIRVARGHEIPVFNLAVPEDWDKLDVFVSASADTLSPEN